MNSTKFKKGCENKIIVAHLLLNLCFILMNNHKYVCLINTGGWMYIDRVGRSLGHTNLYDENFDPELLNGSNHG